MLILKVQLDPALLDDPNLIEDELTADQSQNPYFGLGFLQYPLFIFRASIGDYNVDSFRQMPAASRIAAWTLWITIVFINTVVFLNFLISVIGDAFNKVMETKNQERYQTKANYIVEFEDILFTKKF